MKSRAIPSRLGLITSSFGRTFDFLMGLYMLESIDDKAGHMLEKRMRRTIWIKPNREQFPYITSLLSEKLRIVNSSYWLFVYRFFSKLRLRFFLSSTSDIDYIPYCYTDIEQTQLINAVESSYQNTMLKSCDPMLLNLLSSDREIALVYVRNSFWDLEQSGPLSDVLKSEAHRNIDSKFLTQLIAALESKGLFVVRIGRDDLSIAESDSFLNYASKKYANDLLDLMLFRRAFCLFSSAGGADTPRVLFKTPTMFLNAKEPFSDILTSQLNFPTAVLPSSFLKKDGDLFSKDDIMTLGLNTRHGKTKDFTKICDFRENNSETTVNAAIDFIDYLRGISNNFVEFFWGGEKVSIRWENLQR